METPCMLMSGQYASYWNAFLFQMFVTARQRSCWKVTFQSCLSISYSVHSGGVPMWPLTMMHWISLYSPPPALVRTSRHQTWDTPFDPVPVPAQPEHYICPLLVTSGGGYWSTHGRWKRAVRILLERFLVSNLWTALFLADYHITRNVLQSYFAMNQLPGCPRRWRFQQLSLSLYFI